MAGRSWKRVPVGVLSMACFFFGVFSFGAAVYFLFPPPSLVWGLVFFFLSAVIPGVGGGLLKRRRQREWLIGYYGTFEEFRGSFDVEPLRKLKNQRGKLAALRHLKRNYPMLSVELAVQLIDDL